MNEGYWSYILDQWFTVSTRTTMNTDAVRKTISIKGRKIVNVFPGPSPLSIVVATVPKHVDVQFELFSKAEVCGEICEQAVEEFTSRVLDTLPPTQAN